MEMTNEQKEALSGEQYEKFRKLMRKSEQRKKMIKLFFLSEFIGIICQMLVNFRGPISWILWIAMDILAIGGAAYWIYSIIYRFRRVGTHWGENLDSDAGLDTLPPMLFPGYRLMNEMDSGKFRWGDVFLVLGLAGVILISGIDLLKCIARIFVYCILYISK